jgi:isoleucyl-tRNA synthetase
MASTYKDTLNLPETKFPMKADLVRREPDIRKRWAETDLYYMLRTLPHPKGRYVLHDGPPYANGDIHIGTGVNKVLKDLVIKYKTMQGYDSPYIPGWDCHGQPIEHKVRQELGSKAAAMGPVEIRKLCEEYAAKYAKQQSEQFQLLGVLGRWEKPYLTMTPDYEQGEMEVLAKLADEGLIHRELRAIHWCMVCGTALAEAEIEYQDDEGPSIYVLFEVDLPPADPAQHTSIDAFLLSQKAAGSPVYLMVWTTTPWTLPANLAVAVHPDFEYSAVRFRDKAGKSFVAIVATELITRVASDAGLEVLETGSEHKMLGKEIGASAPLGLRYKHPFMSSPLVLSRTIAWGGNQDVTITISRRVIADAAMVTLEEGTGLVHSAPGHGREDNLMGLRSGLFTYSPVDASGRMDKADPNLPDWIRGQTVWQANDLIINHLLNSGHLVGPPDAKKPHRYPHCWRCRKPVIFRATEQWFVELDRGETGKSLRERALDAVGGVQWVPASSESRIRAMIETRPDWCISRQKVWDVPIPALYCEGCGEALMTGDMMRAAGKFYGKHGSGAWYENEKHSLADIFGAVPACPKCGGAKWRKETDVFDVWLDSGASWRSVCEAEGLGIPVDLYFEGSDQHRGWFQSSLILGVVARGQPPFRTCITHGWVMDEQGRKMSKSLGNVVSVLDEVKRLGADVLRLWASSVDYSVDIRASDSLISILQEGYRKIRNTLRYLLGNLGDYDAKKHAVRREEMEEIDRWLLARLARLVADVTAQMDAFQFHRVYQLVHVFCVNDLSAFYLDVQKDVMYCDAADSPRRRSGQTAMAQTADVLVRLLAPILVHTAEEAWGYLPAPAQGERAMSVHMAEWPQVDAAVLDEKLLAKWEWLEEVRRDAYAILEIFRQRGKIDKYTEARVAMAVADAAELAKMKEVGAAKLADLMMVSELVLVTPEEAKALAGETVSAEETQVKRFASATRLEQAYKRCERCWTFRPTVGQAQPADVCDRCAKVVAGRKRSG